MSWYVMFEDGDNSANRSPHSGRLVIRQRQERPDSFYMGPFGTREAVQDAIDDDLGPPYIPPNISDAQRSARNEW